MSRGGSAIAGQAAVQALSAVLQNGFVLFYSSHVWHFSISVLHFLPVWHASHSPLSAFQDGFSESTSSHLLQTPFSSCAGVAGGQVSVHVLVAPSQNSPPSAAVHALQEPEDESQMGVATASSVIISTHVLQMLFSSCVCSHC